MRGGGSCRDRSFRWKQVKGESSFGLAIAIKQNRETVRDRERESASVEIDWIRIERNRFSDDANVSGVKRRRKVLAN